MKTKKRSTKKKKPHETLPFVLYDFKEGSYHPLYKTLEKLQLKLKEIHKKEQKERDSKDV